MMGQITIIFPTLLLLEVLEEVRKYVHSFPSVYSGNVFARVTHEQLFYKNSMHEFCPVNSGKFWHGACPCIPPLQTKDTCSHLWVYRKVVALANYVCFVLSLYSVCTQFFFLAAYLFSQISLLFK